MKHCIAKPECLFLLFAIPVGLILTFLVPPLGGGDEGFHYQRIASIAYGQILNKPVEVPASIIQFLKTGSDFFYAGLQPPFHYSMAEFYSMAGIGLNPGNLSSLQPNYTTIHHPFSYAPQVLLFIFGKMLGLAPLSLLYVMRLAGLAAGIGLTFLAIRKMPSHQYALCAIALLPTITFYRSYVNADALTDGLAFLFIATVLHEITLRTMLKARDIFAMAVMAFVLAQCKSAYLPLAFLVLAIPTERFTSVRMRAVSLALIILPGAIASLAWMILIKQTYFTGIQYHTWGGNANPEMQADFVLHHPVIYLLILIKTVCCSKLLPLSYMGIFADVGPGYFLQFPTTILLFYFLVGVIITDRPQIRYDRNLRLLSAGIFLAAIFISLTLLYIQWTGYGLMEIRGFQGRYLFPLFPLLLTYVNPPGKTVMSLKTGSYVALLAFFGLTASLWRITLNYY
jgi:uncharacterized membrane protein